MPERIERPLYLNKLIEFQDKDIVKIVTGIRRCGKSTLLDLYEDYLLRSGVKAQNILHMNMESLQHRDLLSYLTFYDYVSNHIVKKEKNYLIFDELQTVTHWEKAIDQVLLNKLVLFLADNIGTVTSPNNIGNVLSSEGEINRPKSKNSVAGKTVNKYITMLKSAFIFYSVNRYDIKGKQLLKTLGKNYMVDLGFRNMLLGYRDIDRGHILENVVFLELLRRNYHVSIGKIGETEVDFIAEKPDEKLYIQVTETMSGEATRERELRPLRRIKDNYEKIVLSMDKSFIKSYDGIKAVNILDFLLEEQK